MLSIKKYILEQVAKQGISQDAAKELLIELATGNKPQVDEIAIIGMAGRFPMAGNAEEYWKILRSGRDCIRDFPEHRRKDFEHILRNPHFTEFLIGDSIRPEDIPYAHAQAGYLDEIDKFDAGFFGITPTEATFMDPHQRLALELAWETMEDAGYGGKRLYGSNTGIYIGKEGTNYSLYRYTSVNNPMKLTGSWESIMVSRISYLFDFKGPCMLVDTACSSGLVSIHMAAQAILNGECDQAIAGGINLSITGEFNTRFQGSMAMDAVESKDGTIRTFDARANGTVWGEGVAMVMLKSLSRAIADRDHIHAVIKGSAVNNDGASSGLTAPDAESQEQVIVKAWKKAKIDPASLSYVEAHGTGTVLGDPIEFKGLTAAFRKFTNKRQFCAIGSLKTNMGHLVAASGVASLFKVVKSLEHKEMAPTINFGKPNPYIDFLSSPLYVNDAARPWETDGNSRRAALSSFGFSHTNCHMIVEEAPARPELLKQKAMYCFTLSAHTQNVLLDYVERLRVFATEENWNLADVCYTTNLGRGHYPYRLAIVAATQDELRKGLDASVAVIKGELQREYVQYRHHLIVSSKKKQLDTDEITDARKKTLSEEAAAKLEQFVAGKGSDRSLLNDIAKIYVEGGEVNWDKFYAGELRNRLSLPTYPFQRIRVWADPKISKIASFDTRLHPLVDKIISSSDAEDIFESVFRSDTHWILSDHKIKGTCVVPGTTYLEMARVAARAAAHPSQGWEHLEMRDVFFLEPMVVEDGESRRVRIHLYKSDALLEFKIESAADANDDWQLHVEGKIGQCTGLSPTALDIAKLKSKATETIENYQNETDTGVFQFGPHWGAVRSAWRIGDDALARLSLPEALSHELGVFLLHPSVLDNAVNLLSQSTGSTFLPFTYKSVKVFAQFSTPLYSHVISKLHKESAQTLTYDVILADEQGQVVAEISDYVVKKVNSFAGLGASGTDADGEYLVTRWVPQSIDLKDRPLVDRLILITDEQSPHDALVDGFKVEGIEITRISLVNQSSPSQDQGLRLYADDLGFSKFAVSDILDGVGGIVFSIGSASNTSFCLENDVNFSRSRNLGVDALFRLTKALLNAKVKLAWGMCVLTEHAYRVDGSEKSINPLGASAAALGTVIGMEYKGLPCRLVDMGANLDGLQLARHILAVPTGRQTALRAGSSYVRELFPQRLESIDAETVREDGVYLITGGLGGLGLATAKHIASKAKARVVLAGRSPIAARTDWRALAGQSDVSQAAKYSALLELSEELGALDYVVCDVGSATEVNDLLARVRAEHGPLRGIFHLAGVAGDGFLLRKEFSSFDAVMKPKLDGLRNFYAATAGDKLDYFVFFSSVTALTGGEGQGDYTAANAFMDALAWHGSLDGRTCITVNWPGWKEIGMAADFQVGDDDSPFVSLSPYDAFDRLDRILAHGMQNKLTQILPTTINPAGIIPVRDVLPFMLSSELQRRLTGNTDEVPDNKSNVEDIQVAIHGKDEEDLTETEILLSKIYAAVLGLVEIDVFTNFHDMGGNSIIATHLLKLIDVHFKDMVDISDVFSYSSIDEMAAYIDDKRERVVLMPKAKAEEFRWEDSIARVMDGGDSIDSILDKI